MESVRSTKPSIKRRAPPQIRQTRTSAYRILKANPLMMHDRETVAKMGIQDTKTIPKSVDILGISKQSDSVVLNNAADKEPSNSTAVNLVSFKKLQNTDIKAKAQNLKDPKRYTQAHNTNRGILSRKEPIRQSISRMYRQTQQIPRRRSKSAESFNPSKCIKKSNYGETRVKLETSQSMNELCHNSFIATIKGNVCKSKDNVECKQRSNKEHESKRRSRSIEDSKNVLQEVDAISNISRSTEELTRPISLDISMSPIKKQQPTFKTPIAYNRRSVFCRTPCSGEKSTYRLHSSTPAAGDLQRRLNEWLAKRGKSLSSFHHLQCFGVSKNTINECKENNRNKENTLNKNLKLEYIKNIDHIDTNLKTVEKEHTPEPNYEYIAKDALHDLHRLIQDGYMLDQCEAWLGRIKHKYHQLEEEPLYWECRAAIEQGKGNISSAVESYRKAIVKGAEVHTIEESLDQLLRKFSLLKIDPEVNGEDTATRKINLDVQNAFKSTIIQFAVQERMLKKKEEDAKKKVTVTPVRRSSRLSMKHAGSSRIKVCASLKEIQMDENTEFQTNSYLSIRFSPQ